MLTFHIDKKLHFSKNASNGYIAFCYESLQSIFIEVDKALFNTKPNTILGEICKPPSANKETFNIEMERLLVKINKENSMLS